MKKTLLVLTAILTTSFCYAQEITKDGYGPLYWGATVAEAEKVFPHSRKVKPDYIDRRSSVGKSSWMIQNGIPCDLLLHLPQSRDNSGATLYFYNGKFVGLTSTYHLKQIPIKSADKSLDDDLRQKILKALGNTDLIDAGIIIFNAPEGGLPTPTGWVQDMQFTLRLANKQLVQDATTDIQNRLEKYKDELREDVPTALLNP